MEGTVLGEPACSCSNTQIDATTVTRTTAVGDISCFDPTHFQVYVLRTTSRFDGCSQGDGPGKSTSSGCNHKLVNLETDNRTHPGGEAFPDPQPRLHFRTMSDWMC